MNRTTKMRKGQSILLVAVLLVISVFSVTLFAFRPTTIAWANDGSERNQKDFEKSEQNDVGIKRGGQRL